VLEARGPVDLEPELVDEAPPPVLTRLIGLDQRMAGLVEVVGGVVIGRVVATTDVTADHAHPQMDPPASDALAVLTSVRRRDDLLHLVKVIAVLLGFGHGRSSHPRAPVGGVP
jgi:hypothetical protein